MYFGIKPRKISVVLNIYGRYILIARKLKYILKIVPIREDITEVNLIMQINIM